MPVSGRVPYPVALRCLGVPVRVGTGSGWLLSRLCVAPTGIYARSGVGNQTAQLCVNTHTLTLPSGVCFLAGRVAAVPSAEFVAFLYGVGLCRVWGFFSAALGWPSHCRPVYGLCTC